MSKLSPTQSVFGRRLREARLRADIPQDRLGVMIGLDEGCSNARMSRYEAGVHEPPFKTIAKIANALEVPVAYFFCTDDRLAEIMRIYFSAQDEDRQAMYEAVIAVGGWLGGFLALLYLTSEAMQYRTHYRYKCGTVSPSFPQLENICAALDVTAWVLFSDGVTVPNAQDMTIAELLIGLSSRDREFIRSYVQAYAEHHQIKKKPWP